MRAFDWSETDMGPPAGWPENLRIAVSLCLTSRFPILICWGPSLAILYNDAYIPLLGETKHPRVLGLPGQEVWGEIWDSIGPMLEGVRATGQAAGSEDLLSFSARNLPREEVHFRFSYGPILSADGRTVEGIFCLCTEITAEVVGARRLETLRKLGVKVPDARTAAAACREAARALAENPMDLPFAAIYVVDENGVRATLAATAGTPEGDHPLPTAVSTTADDPSPWPLASVLCLHRPEELDLGAAGLRIPGTVWPEPAERGLVLPIAAPGHVGLAGLLVVGVSPRQVLDADYRTFFEHVAAHIGTALADARAYAVGAGAFVEQRLQFALSAARMGTWSWDVASDTLTRDANLNRLLGLGPIETRRPSGEMLALVHPGDRAVVAEVFEACANQRRGMNLEFRVIRPSGAVLWLRHQGGAFGGPEDGPPHMVGASVDITDLMETEEALRRARKELEHRVAARWSEPDRHPRPQAYATALELLRTAEGFSDRGIEAAG